MRRTIKNPKRRKDREKAANQGRKQRGNPNKDREKEKAKPEPKAKQEGNITKEKTRDQHEEKKQKQTNKTKPKAKGENGNERKPNRTEGKRKRKRLTEFGPPPKRVPVYITRGWIKINQPTHEVQEDEDHQVASPPCHQPVPEPKILRMSFQLQQLQ
jgi:hypothetical protein